MVTLGDNHVTDTADILLICAYSLRRRMDRRPAVIVCLMRRKVLFNLVCCFWLVYRELDMLGLVRLAVLGGGGRLA